MKIEIEITKSMAITALIAFVLGVGAGFIIPHKTQVGEPAKPAQEQPAVKKPSTFKYGMPADKAMAQKKKPVVAYFYVDWCHYCQQSAPSVFEVSKQLKDKYVFAPINCEDPKNKEIVEEYKIDAFPTMYVVDPQTKKKLKVENQTYFDPGTLRTELENLYTEIKK